VKDVTGTWHVTGESAGWRWQDLPARVLRLAEQYGVEVRIREDVKHGLYRNVVFEAKADTLHSLQTFADEARRTV
jgi:hypothetical protein